MSRIALQIKTYVLRVDKVPSEPSTSMALCEELLKKVKVGDRLFLQEWSGAPTGRARLVKVTALVDGSAGSEPTWGWSRGAEDPSKVLGGLSLVPEPDQFPVWAPAMT
jgi:hypothetical protein